MRGIGCFFWPPCLLFSFSRRINRQAVQGPCCGFPPLAYWVSFCFDVVGSKFSPPPPPPPMSFSPYLEGLDRTPSPSWRLFDQASVSFALGEARTRTSSERSLVSVGFATIALRTKALFSFFAAHNFVVRAGNSRLVGRVFSYFFQLSLSPFTSGPPFRLLPFRRQWCLGLNFARRALACVRIGPLHFLLCEPMSHRCQPIISLYDRPLMPRMTPRQLDT